MKIKTGDLKWEELRKDVSRKHLAKDEERNLQMDIMNLAPNSKHAEHIHPNVEWVYVLEGSFSDEHDTYEADDFLVNEKDSKHIVKAGSEGAIILVFWCGKIINT